jgi:crossover junction endodeoxyribonuclease RuvC
VVNGAYLERVNAMAGQGVSSVFSFGRSSGIVEGILAAYDITTTLVTPQTWQKSMEVRGGKDGSRERAMQLFPMHAAMFARVKDDGRADAALMAAYGEKMMK